MLTCLIVLACLYAVAYQPGSTSKYWGANGELADYTGRISDWSYAGYRMVSLAQSMLELALFAQLTCTPVLKARQLRSATCVCV